MNGIICVGAGAIGSLIGARLQQAGARVVLVGRGDHLKAIQDRGLRLEGRGSPDAEAETVWVPAVNTVSEALAEVGDPSAVILTVKAYDAAATASGLAHELGLDSAGPRASPPVVLCLQNGLGSEETVARYLGGDRVLSGAITLSVERPAPGRLRLLTDHGGIAWGPHNHAHRAASPTAAVGSETTVLPPSAAPGGGPSSPGPVGPASAVLDLAGTLTQAGFRLRLCSRGDAVKWSKVLLNLWANASSAVFDVPPSRIAADPMLFELDWTAFREALDVMRAARVPVVNLPGYPVRLLAALGRALPRRVFRRLLAGKVAGGRGGKMPSLWIDLQAGRTRSEVTFLNRAVADTGKRLGLPTPANQALAQALEILTAPEGVQKSPFASDRHLSTSS